ncbi:MAG TPA: hypothetical protein VJ044_00500, partial [Candidatus Hodarchaeales archaeon]|nr:hypothetical protein [Candidatus Hodarchaeales archaeon]
MTSLSHEHPILDQLLAIVHEDDVLNLDYLLRAVVPQIHTFWEIVGYLQISNLWLGSNATSDQLDSDRKWFLDQEQVQLRAAERFILDHSAYELMWIIPFL